MLGWIGRGYRIVATGFCFTTFGVGGLLLAFVVFPISRLLWRDAKSRKACSRRCVHYSFRCFVRLMRWVQVLDYDFQAEQLLRSSQGKIIIANHPTLIDVVSIIAMTPNADCVVKQTLFKNPFMRGVIAGTGYISNCEPDLLLDDCIATLRAGNNLIIFPEGTRSTPGQPFHFLRGAANIALLARVDFLALWIECSPSTLTKQECWYQVPAHKPKLTIRYLREFEVSRYLQVSSKALAARQLTREVQHFYHQVRHNHECTQTGTETADHLHSGA